MPDRLRAVIVEDDILIAEYFRELCGDFGLDIVGQADEGGQAIEIIRRTAPDRIIMDLRLVGLLDGVDVANAIRIDVPDAKIIYVTGSSEPSSLARIGSGHPHRVLIKPIEPAVLRAALRS